MSSMEKYNSVFVFYTEMEAHSSGLGRKRKRAELNGEMKEAECFRKRPRRTLVSIGKVAVSQHSNVLISFPVHVIDSSYVFL